MDAASLAPIAIVADPARTLMQAVEEERKTSAPSKFRWEDVRTFRDYARGRQRDTLSPEQRRMLRGVQAHRRADNVANKVVFELANRLQLTGWAVDDKAASDFLAELWVKCHLPKLAGETHYATVRDGNHAIGLNWQRAQGRVVLSRMRWWDGRAGVWVAYGGDGEPAYAVNEWQDGTATRRTLYYDDRIARYVADGDGWRPLQLPDDETWPVRWEKRDGSPLHVPIVHFPAGSDDDTPYGASILDGGVLGLQDDVNDIQSDLTVAGRMTAYQMYYATGVTPALDAAGEPIPTEVVPGAFLENENAAARYGVLPAGDTSQLIAARGVKLQAVSIDTGTPIHLITGGDWPSGEALLRAEGSLVNRAAVLVDAAKPPWATVGHRATEMANTFGDGPPLDEDALIAAEFAPVERRDALTLAQVDVERLQALLIKQTLGWSLAAIQREWGLTNDEIATMERERQAEAEAAGLTAPIETTPGQRTEQGGQAGG